MADDRTKEWDQRYRDGTLPWDTGEASAELRAVWAEVAEVRSAKRAIDVGCGTGTNVIWLAGQGAAALGIDLSPAAVEQARAKARQAGVAGATFAVHDILLAPPPGAGAIDLVFDRGCYHAMPAEARATFARHVRQALRPGGWWLSLSGNADQPGEPHAGPPRLTAREIIDIVEDGFEVYHLRRIHFASRLPHPPLAWSCLMRRRG